MVEILILFGNLDIGNFNCNLKKGHCHKWNGRIYAIKILFAYLLATVILKYNFMSNVDIRIYNIDNLDSLYYLVNIWNKRDVS